MILIALLLSAGARSEDLGFDSLNQFALSQGFDAASFFQRLISGDMVSSLTRFGDIPGMIRDGMLKSLSELIQSLALPLAACMLIRLLTGSRDASLSVNLLCVLCSGTVLIQAWLSVRQQLTALIDAILRATDAMTPVMMSAAALTGGTFWSTAAGPLSNLCASLLQRVLREWGIGLCGSAAAVALSGAVTDRFSLNRLFELIKSATHWMLGIVVFIYGGLVSAQGIVGAAKDGATLQTAKMAIENVVPIVGSGVSDVAGSIAISAGLARKAIGITGVALIARMCLYPMLKLGLGMLSLKIIAAVVEPMAACGTTALIAQFGDIYEMALAIGICSGAMAAMIPLGCAVLTNGLL